MGARPLEAYDYIAIVELIFYLIALVGGIALCIKHGFTKNAGWRGLIFLGLTRVIGASFRLATIEYYTNESLYIGWVTLKGLGLVPLVLLTLGLLSRIFESINRQGQVFINNKHQRILEILLMVALILFIVGGVESKFNVEANGTIVVTFANLSRIAVYLLIAAVLLVCLEVVIAFRCQGYIVQGEHRILFAVIASVPFLLVRLLYTCLIILAGKTSSAWLYLAMSTLMEMAVTLITEVMGFTLDKVPHTPVPQYDEEMQGMRK